MTSTLSPAWTGASLLLLCALALANVAQAQKKSPTQKEISKELAALYASDHKDQAEWTEASDDAEFDRRQRVRRERVVEIVAAGMLATTEDFSNAGWLLQHGNGADDYLLAHILVTVAGFESAPLSRWGSAATLDRFLMSIGKAQRFSTQIGGPNPGDPALEPFDESLPQSIRKEFDCEPRATQSDSKEPAKPDKGAKGAKKANPKDLPGLLKQARAALEAAEEPDPTGAPPEWLVSARAIVSGGQIKSRDEYFDAASILSLSTAEDDAVVAHILALAAAFKGHDQGRKLSAETLDHLLLVHKRSQLFGTQMSTGPDAKPIEPSDTSLHEVVRRAYSIGAGAKGGKKAR